MSEEVLQIVEKRKEVKGKGEEERYTHQNAEFQRIARRDKKAFLSDQCKEIEENNRMGKTRDLFKKTGDTKGIFHAEVGTVKDRNDMDLSAAEDIKKRWQDDAVKVLHSICQQICKTQQWPQGWKRSVFIPIPKKDNAKECSK